MLWCIINDLHAFINELHTNELHTINVYFGISIYMLLYLSTALSNLSIYTFNDIAIVYL